MLEDDGAKERRAALAAPGGREEDRNEKDAWEGVIGRADSVRIFTHRRRDFDSC